MSHSLSLLKLKHWHVLVIFVLATIGATYLAEWINARMGWHWESSSAKTCEYFFTTIVYLSYPVLVGRRLTEVLTNDATGSRYIYVRALVILVVLTVTRYFSHETPTDQTVMQLLLVVAFFFCMYSLVAGPAKVLAAMESGSPVTLSDYATNMFQFFVWPVGAFWIQPRLNEIAKEPPGARN